MRPTVVAMEGHPRPRAGEVPQAQPQPPHDAVSPSQYTTFPEVATNSPDSAAPQVVYYSAPEAVPPHHYTSYKQHATSDVSPTSLGQAFDDKQLAYPFVGQAPEDKHLAYPEYESMAPSPPGHEPSPEMAEELAMKKKKRKRTIWILVAIAILLVIAVAVGGGVGGAVAARSKTAQEASQSSSNTQPNTSSTSQPGTTSTSQPSTSSASRPSSTSSSGSITPSPTPAGNGTRTGGAAGEVCIEGTGEGNFSGLCSFACHYGYVPAPCTCKAWGAQVQPPPSTGQKGFPRVDVPDRCSYLGLCSFAWDRGYTDNLSACSPDPAGGVGCT